MNPVIHNIRLGGCNAYLIESRDGFVLVDAGSRRKEGKFKKWLSSLGVEEQSVRLIVVTHVHFDHVGSLAAIKNMCQCPVAIHEAEKDLLVSGKVVIPPGANMIGRAASRLGVALGPKRFQFDPVSPEIVISEERSLEEFGLSARLMPTPGHTKGSISLLLDSGEAFIGDIAMNPLPFGLGPIFPPFAEDIENLFKTWQALLSHGATTFYPGHGRPFSASRLEREYKRRTRT